MSDKKRNPVAGGDRVRNCYLFAAFDLSEIAQNAPEIQARRAQLLARRFNLPLSIAALIAHLHFSEAPR